MLFSDYVTTLRKHCKRTISIQKLCELLFDFVIDNATVENGEKKPFEIGKDRISKMMNGKDGVHQFIRNHIYDESVTDNLVLFFQKNVLPRLVDDTDDLIFQLMQKINKDNISPSHKAMFKKNANSKALAVFLADTFQYAIATNSNEYSQEENTKPAALSKPAFVIKGIENNKTVETPIIQEFVKRIGYSKDTLIEKIERMITEAMLLHVDHYEPSSSGISDWFRGSSYEYEEYKVKAIKMFCSIREIELSKDFFDMGDLYVESIPSLGQFGLFYNNICGSQEARNKLKSLNDIYDSIKDAMDKFPFLDFFSSLFYLDLAIENTGSDFDNDVRVTLRFPHNSVLTPADVMKIDREARNFFVFKTDSLMIINRGTDYLSFYEDGGWIPPHNIQLPFDSDKEAKIEDVQDLMQYYLNSTEEYDTVEIKFNTINQHITTAFPCPILLKSNDVHEIDYSIRTKKSPDIMIGNIKLSR